MCLDALYVLGRKGLAELGLSVTGSLTEKQIRPKFVMEGSPSKQEDPANRLEEFVWGPGKRLP